MLSLLQALMSKFSGSAFSADVGGRIYLDEAPAGAQFPYGVFFIVSAPKEKTFTEEYQDTLIQFSLFSTSKGAAEITTMYNDLSALLDECSLTITGSSLVWCREQNLATMVDEMTTPEGTASVKHWAVDFEIKTSLN
ncbi:MAG: tail completion protein gp17 [Syntrophorhabdaceae bacterium]